MMQLSYLLPLQTLFTHFYLISVYHYQNIQEIPEKLAIHATFKRETGTSKVERKVLGQPQRLQMLLWCKLGSVLINRQG